MVIYDDICECFEPLYIYILLCMHGLKGNKHKKTGCALCRVHAKRQRAHVAAACASGRPFGQAKWPLSCSLLWWHTTKREAFAVFPRRLHTTEKGKGWAVPYLRCVVSSPCSSHGVAHGKEKLLPCFVMICTQRMFECLPCFLVGCTRQRPSDVAPLLSRDSVKCIFVVFLGGRHTTKALPCSTQKGTR
jgi:hypothetical protein